MTDDPGQRAREDFRLAAFIRSHAESIVAEWVAFARTRTPASDSMTHLALQDHIVEILTFIADDLDSSQTSREQSEKSKGRGPVDSALTHSAAQIHASLRLSDGFDIDQMVSEYRALRASVVKQWVRHKRALAPTDLEDLTRFNEAIDQSVAESVAQYTKIITGSRNLFLGILGHDLRNPLSAAFMAARSMVRNGAPEERQTQLAAHIVDATERGIEILDELLDLTRSAFGLDIPLTKQAIDVGQLAAKLVEEMKPLAAGRNIKVAVKGDTTGDFDAGRLGQVFSNLLGNAIQYSPLDSDILISVDDQGDWIAVSVRNFGVPIPTEELSAIFQPMTRGGDPAGRSTSLGLGLFIAQKIVMAHGGTLTVTSSSEAGTIFKARLPRMFSR